MTRTADLRKRGALDRNLPASPITGEDARELLAASIGSDPYERIEELRQLGERKAEASGVAYQMERERKPMLARIATEYARLHADEDLSEAKLERLARADERYRNHIEGTAAAIKERELANSEYWAVRSLLEWDKTAVAHLNALSRLEEPA